MSGGSCEALTASPTDGSSNETKEVMGGICLIEAKDYDEAVERTLDPPYPRTPYHRAPPVVFAT
jgi:hypothetical protein